MITIIDLLSIFICTLILIKAINRLFIYGVNVYYVLLCVFYSVQVFPLITDHIYKEQLISLNPIIFKAMTDVRVALMYDLFVVIVSIVLYKWALNEKGTNISSLLNALRNIRFSKRTNAILVIISFLPFISIAFSPDPHLYTNFAFLYNLNITATLADSLFFSEIVSPTIYISLIAILTLYADVRRKKWYIYILIALVLWISQKRAFIFFAFGGVLFIDILQQRFQKQIIKFFKKVIILITFSVGYFIAYANNTIKNINDDAGYSTYVTYGTRHYCMKTAIYDNLNGSTILKYPGQSILFDLFFFVPRTYWEDKPVMYQRYFTAYVLGLDVDANVEKWLNLLVNIWTEFVSNFGLILGCLMALFLIKLLVNISKNNTFSYLSVSLFLSVYFSFGFEPIVMLFYVFWLFTMIMNKSKFYGNNESTIGY